MQPTGRGHLYFARRSVQKNGVFSAFLGQRRSPHGGARAAPGPFPWQPRPVTVQKPASVQGLAGRGGALTDQCPGTGQPVLTAGTVPTSPPTHAHGGRLIPTRVSSRPTVQWRTGEATAWQ